MKLARSGILLLSLVLAGCTSSSYKITDIMDARALSNRGMDFFAAGDVKGALKAFDAVIAYGSLDDDVFARRAAVYGTIKQYDKALADADKAVELAPGAWRRYLERAILQQRIGHYDEAITDLDKAVVLQPNQVELLRRRAYLKVIAMRFDDAVTDYENLINVLPRSDTGPLGRGAALYLAGKWREAAQQFSDMLKAKPNDGLAALWLTKAKLRQGQFFAWEEVEAGAGPEPEWAMTRALLTLEADADLQPVLAHADFCERALFLGFWRATRQGGQGAVEAFETAKKACPLDSIEASETQAELARLKKGRFTAPPG